MQTIKRFFAENDLDDLLAYRTPKVVVLRDRYLGLLHYILLICIFVYIIGYVLIMEGGYLDRDEPSSTFRLTLREPTGDPDISFCNYNPKRLETTELSYCAENEGCTFDCEECRYADWRWVLFPADASDTLFLTTRVTESLQDQVCDPINNSTCFEPYATVSSQTTYVANIEDFTIAIFHSVRATNFFEERVANGNWNFQGNPYKQLNIAGSNSYVRGVLKAATNEDMCEFEKDANDIIPVRMLLEAAELNLDDVTDAGGTRSSRYEGAVVIVAVEYDNEGSHSYTISYVYRPLRVPLVDYKIEEIRNWENGSRTVNNRHGVLFIVEATGQICRPDFQIALVQLVSAMALTAVAAMMVDMLALKILPLRKHYDSYKHEYSTDFSDVRDRLVEERDLTQLTSTSIRSKYAPIQGTSGAPETTRLL